MFKERGSGRGRKRKVEEAEPEYIPEDDYGVLVDTEGIPDAAKNDVEKQDEQVLEDEFGAKDYRLQMELKPDCTMRPLWVVRRDLELFCCIFFFDWHDLFIVIYLLQAPNGHIFLESFSPVYKHAHDFLIAISEPVCRPEHIHEVNKLNFQLISLLWFFTS